ncbi:uncharacterized protein EMH_0020980 [Eimeria mitis]|uniref:Uncharacterized protein n=1 Tax=Eimeria mitis TaxID=44415 RepID=U6KE90_9EIME|nr:uncharacterized protein EMH_0020980 [Eimeria mitis]CDJ34557.1 hypothetical protein EMH_0020980 [Eimeria mitis]
MCPAEAEPPQAGAAEVSPESEGAKIATTPPSPAPPAPGAQKTAEPVSESTAAADVTVEGRETRRETSCGSSGAPFDVGTASTPEHSQQASAGTAAPRPAAATVQTATTEHEKNPTSNDLGGNTSAFVDVMYNLLRLVLITRVEAGRLLLERLRAALLQQAAAASAFAASLNVAAETLKPLSTESKYVGKWAEQQKSRVADRTELRSYSCLLSNSALQAKELCDALRRDVVASTLERTIENHAQSYSCLLSNSALQAKELCDALRRDVVASTLERTIENHAQVKLDAAEAQRRNHLAAVEHQRHLQRVHQLILHRYALCCAGNGEISSLQQDGGSSSGDSAGVTNYVANDKDGTGTPVGLLYIRSYFLFLIVLHLADPAEVLPAGAVVSAMISITTASPFCARCIRLCVEARQAEEAYVASVQALQQRSKMTRERVQSILSCLEEMDVKRMQCLRDALTRAGVFVAANLRHMQYDLDRSIQVGYCWG